MKYQESFKAAAAVKAYKEIVNGNSDLEPWRIRRTMKAKGIRSYVSLPFVLKEFGMLDSKVEDLNIDALYTKFVKGLVAGRKKKSPAIRTFKARELSGTLSTQVIGRYLSPMVKDVALQVLENSIPQIYEISNRDYFLSS